MPAGYAPYKRTAAFTQATVPKGLLHDHQTKPGVWALLHVTSGALEFLEREGSGEVGQRVSAGQRATIRPGVAHRVMLPDAVEFSVEFWRAGAAAG